MPDDGGAGLAVLQKMGAKNGVSARMDGWKQERNPDRRTGGSGRAGRQTGGHGRTGWRTGRQNGSDGGEKAGAP